MELWGFFLDIPEGVGGDEPSLEHKIAKCDRCGQSFSVKRKDEAETCIYHWGKPVSRTVSGRYAHDVFAAVKHYVTRPESTSIQMLLEAGAGRRRMCPWTSRVLRIQG